MLPQLVLSQAVLPCSALPCTGGSLHQLALTDGGSNTRASWLYKLVTGAPHAPGSLQLFRNVVLVASAQVRVLLFCSCCSCCCPCFRSARSRMLVHLYRIIRC